ncbi:related to glucose-inducible SAM-dependent methyltransferase Rrg1, putative [Ramularia collo-cygni]|uniref:Related to glucose-inducible SAM-dependent methyltransferase Rrg1, putative n=1 Tax=Ramularia collo-cygni TaxID=112498 RepID=A0A2D3V4Z1_9PEZI|nr:related to glucose-inducible SAM-dependent methyltransferase Rrg1, putative [Ramularia collo-cygni]CZT17574.1 related to glucose-inducible SAM-dependent methyltransferase Rrg1, putative [Ramularia collo-cygni]
MHVSEMQRPAAGLTAQDLGLEAEIEEAVVDVIDLPQLHTKPNARTLLSTLADFSSEPPSWEATPRTGTPRTPLSGVSTPLRKSRKIKHEGSARYLTNIVGSDLAWIEDEDVKENIWEAASKRLSERSGRSAMGDIRRSFYIPLSQDDVDEGIEIVLHEPALTGDSLGLKTWASSNLLARRLLTLRPTLPPFTDNSAILELGSGTGLVGLAAAAAFQAHVVLTDLPDIVPNLRRNALENEASLKSYGAKADAAVLDWTEPASFPVEAHTFALILAADPIYSELHPRLLAQTIGHHLSLGDRSRVIVEMPLRDAYAPERQDFRERMLALGLGIAEEGEEVGFDDWLSGNDDELLEVRCWWSVWKRQ